MLTQPITVMEGLNNYLGMLEFRKLGRDVLVTPYGKIIADRRESGDGLHEFHVNFTLGERFDLAGKTFGLQDVGGNVCGSEILRQSDRNPLVFWSVVKDIPPDVDILIGYISQP